MSVGLTRSRFINALRAYCSYALSLLGLVRVRHAPTFVSVEPASICQLRCPECPVGMRKGEQSGVNGKRERSVVSGERKMPRAVWERTLQEITPTAHTIQFYFQGEPLLHPDLVGMISEAHAKGLYTIVSTNAQAMTEAMADGLVSAGLDRIIVSMDGLTEESYNAYRIGGSLEQCKAALRYLRKAKEKQHASIRIELQCLRLRSNEAEWSEFRRSYRRLGADKLVFKTAQLYDYEKGHALMPSDEKYSRYTKGEDGLYHRKHLSRHCLRVWTGCVITTDGEVLPCCYDKEHAHAYGNIMHTPLRELFGNERATAFRRAAIRQQPTICQQCWK